ncbi:hypothetical protein Baya_14444 [Bagarius yarrelli]|uniref:Uncharacterized protein n=1 Tax=Bagarius yarrelli TaxID=175774 RepID=A0A556V8T8_BAGYA|nr:hypothetical protein Baya_14444 [Bagarius yarrelli]
MAATRKDFQEARPDKVEKPDPVPVRSRSSNVNQRDGLHHNGPCSPPLEQGVLGAEGGNNKKTEKRSSSMRRTELRRPLSLEIKSQQVRANNQCERKVVQPPWRFGAPSPPTRSLTSPSLGPGGWMRRSESTCTVNTKVQPRASRGRMRPATSLPHIGRGLVAAPVTTPSTPRGPCLLVALRPINLDQERQTFFQSDYKYEPQFEYSSPEPVSVLEKYKEGSGLFLTQVCQDK